MLDQTNEKAMFDQNFDNMPILDDCANNQGVLSELLREKGIIRGSKRLSDGLNFMTALADETPDKTCVEEEVEERKAPENYMINTGIRGPFDLVASNPETIDLRSAIQSRCERSFSFSHPLNIHHKFSHIPKTENLKEILATKNIPCPIKLDDAHLKLLSGISGGGIMVSDMMNLKDMPMYIEGRHRSPTDQFYPTERMLTTPRRGSLLVYGDMTAPNTPTGNELTFMSPNLMKND